MGMRFRFGWMVLLLVGAIALGAGQEKEVSLTERVEVTVKGIIVGIQRVTLAVVTHRQVVTYLHLRHEQMPSWLRTGVEVTAHCRRAEDGSLWVEEISPYKPPEAPPSSSTAPSVPPIVTVQPTVTPMAFLSPPIRQGSLTELRERRLGSRGLSSALQNRFNLNPMEMEVQRLLPHYKAAAKFFNPNLSNEQAETIAAALLRSSIQNGVDPRLVVAVIACESSFRPDAVGKKGEIGLGQLKPETAAGLGVDPYDPVQNIDGCVRYLRQQLDRFASLELALAAYNAGPNAVARAGGIPQNGITPRYVQKVLDLYRRLCGR